MDLPGKSPGGLSCEVGYQLNRGRQRRELLRCGKDWLPGRPRERRCLSRTILPCWLRRMERRDKQRRGLPCWQRRLPRCTILRSVYTRRSCIGCTGSYRSETENRRRGEAETKTPLRFPDSPFLLQRKPSRRPLSLLE